MIFKNFGELGENARYGLKLYILIRGMDSNLRKLNSCVLLCAEFFFFEIVVFLKKEEGLSFIQTKFVKNLTPKFNQKKGKTQQILEKNEG